MGKLTNYTAPVSTPEIGGQRASPESMGSAVGAGLEALGKGTQHFYSQMEEDEARTALVASSQIRAKYAAALDEAQTTGGDTGALKEKMTDELSTVGQNFNTKKGLQSLALHSAQSTMMFDDQANRIAVHRASETARLQGQQFLQDQSAVLRSNPSALPIAERNVDDFVATLLNMPPEKRALVAQDLKTQLNMAAVQSLARIDPEGTKQRLIDGEWKLTPREREQGIAETETQMRAIRSDQIHQRQLADYEERKQNAEESNTLLTKIYKGLVQPGEIANSPLPREIRENLSHFQAWLSEDRLNKLQKPHPAEMLRLWNITHADSEDPSKVYNSDEVIKSALAGKLNAGEAEKALSWVANQKDENNRTIGSKLSLSMSEVGRAVSADMTLNWSPQNVAAIQMDYQARVLDRVADLRKANSNPSVVFDPKSKEYIGSPEFIAVSINNIKNKMRREGSAASIGEIREKDGVLWRYKGGNPTLPENWEKAPAGTRNPSELVTQIPQ